ncbi:hypothetical protein [uncultured Psychrosphaera sp.]|uniref:hypothetical protein n=1 Tax=uncultured Psychrosphaera sp. TaxID=1403522 RepID=UPI0030F4E15D
MDLLSGAKIESFFNYFLLVCFAVFVVQILYWLVLWSKKMSKGALIFLTIFPVISIFPIPHQEIKKIENIKQEHIKKKEENAEPLDDE